MNVFLMHRDRGFDLEQGLPPGAADLVQDLALETVLAAMARGDEFVLGVARHAMLASLNEVSAVQYRQDVLRDCIAHPTIVRDLYRLAVEAVEREHRHYWFSANHPSSLLHRSVDVLSMFVELVRRLRAAADAHAGAFRSSGFAAWFAMLRSELSNAYLSEVDGHLARLRFRRGVLISGRLGKGIVGAGHVLRRPNDDDRPWLRRVVTRRLPAHTFHIHERDEAGGRILAELRDRGIDAVANATAQANDHILAFFRTLRTELAFYVGCLNLHETLQARGAHTCFPAPASPEQRRYRVCGLFDPGLALVLDQPVIASDVDADGKDLLMITGANQGGKSTFLRSVGLTQLMLQCGMFVPAQSCEASLCSGLFTHFKREEDAAMRHGKFEEEVQRVSGMVDRVAAHSIVLFNESFQSTNEREGSEIARQLIEALLDSDVRVVFVTHMYDFAAGLAAARRDDAAFLRAERLADGVRTFRITPGAPQSTSYGRDVFLEVFGDALVAELQRATATGSRQAAAATTGCSLDPPPDTSRVDPSDGAGPASGLDRQ